MTSVTFDTLKFVEKLEDGGFTPQQAKAAAQAFAAATGEELATRGDLNVVRADLQRDINDVRTDLQKIESALKSDVRELELRMTIKLGGLIVAATGVILAAIRYLPAGHP